MKKIVILFVLLFLGFGTIFAQESGGYAGLLLGPVGKEIKVKNYGDFLKTNAQFISSNEPFVFNGEIVAVYIQLPKKKQDKKSRDKLDSLLDLIRSQPLNNPYLCFIQEVDRKFLKAIQKADNAKVSKAYVIENFSMISIEAFKKLRIGSNCPEIKKILNTKTGLWECPPD